MWVQSLIISGRNFIIPQAMKLETGFHPLPLLSPYVAHWFACMSIAVMGYFRQYTEIDSSLIYMWAIECISCDIYQGFFASSNRSFCIKPVCWIRLETGSKFVFLQQVELHFTLRICNNYYNLYTLIDSNKHLDIIVARGVLNLESSKTVLK